MGWTVGTGEVASSASSADFDALFLSAHPALVRTVTFVCGDAELAADCVADAFERAYVRWRRVSRLDDPVGWVRRVAVNRAIDSHRRGTRGRRAVSRLAGRAETSRHGELTTSASFGLRDGGVADAVDELSPQQRAVVALHYLDDLAVADVARLLSISEGAVKYHLHQARARLRELLGPDREGDAP